MDKTIYVKDITEEQIPVNDCFVVLRKGTYTTKNNSKYMSVVLRDKTGTIEAKVWDRVEELNELFDRNDIVAIKSRSRIFQEKIQLNRTDIRRIEEDQPLKTIREFFPECRTDIEVLKQDYFDITEGLNDQYLKALFSALKGHADMLEKFFFYPASIGVHHMYVGGLLEHSVSLAKMARHVTSALEGNVDVVLAGCLLHDIGKIEELEVTKGFRYTDRGRLLGHITLGTLILDKLIREIDEFPVSTADVLSHIIVSHHGVEEWGSPKKPMFAEAMIVHYLDNLDAKIMGVREYMKDNMEDEKWSEYHRLYESKFYKIS